MGVDCAKTFANATVNCVGHFTHHFFPIAFLDTVFTMIANSDVCFDNGDFTCIDDADMAVAAPIVSYYCIFLIL